MNRDPLPPIPDLPTPEPASTHVCRWGEGPVWHDGGLWHVDATGMAVHRFSPSTGTLDSWPTGQVTGFVVPRRNGGVVIGGEHGIGFLDPATGRTEPIAHPEAGLPGHRFNDGKCAPDGRLFAGTMSKARTPGAARLYRLDPDLSLHTAYHPVTTSNGIAWSPDGRLCHYVDTPTREVKTFRYDAATGVLCGPVSTFSTSAIDASPDGIAVDADGRIWIAFCHAGTVKAFDPTTGIELASLALPAIETTAVAFGGPDLRDLYITTGIHPTLEEPLAGRLFVARQMPVAGLPGNPFAG